MRINRTYSLPVSLVTKLSRERNQSRTVEKAVYKYLSEKEDYTLSDIPTRQLMAALMARKVDPVLDAALLNQLSTS
jgi:hypothetical protein